MVLIIFHDFTEANKHTLRKTSLWVSHLKKHLRNSNMIQLEKEARFAWQPLVNLLGAHTYKLDSFKSSSPG